MPVHESERGPQSQLRPKAARLDEGDAALAYRAALSGRLDVAGPAGIAGLQRAVGNAGTSALVGDDSTGERSAVHEVIGSGGAPLPADLRADMEGRFGHDFGDVRIHDDSAAHDSAKSVNAQAYTVGSDIVFGHDRYDPHSQAGRHVLAHELTHVVQQRSGPVEGTDVGGGVKVSDPADRFERDAVATADRVMAAPPAPVQRSDDDADEAAARSFVQRQEDEAPPEEEQIR